MRLFSSSCNHLHQVASQLYFRQRSITRFFHLVRIRNQCFIRLLPFDDISLVGPLRATQAGWEARPSTKTQTRRAVRPLNLLLLRFMTAKQETKKSSPLNETDVCEATPCTPPNFPSRCTPRWKTSTRPQSWRPRWWWPPELRSMNVSVKSTCVEKQGTLDDSKILLVLSCRWIIRQSKAGCHPRSPSPPPSPLI